MAHYNKLTHNVLRCLNCGVISVHPRRSSDGRCCGACGGHLKMIGEAVIGFNYGCKSEDITVQVTANGLDEMLEKIKQLELSTAMAVANIKVAKKLLGLDISEA